MSVITSLDEMRALAQEIHRRGERILLVPTMGALHEGHLSLVRRARRAGGALVVSIFVNPAQFGPGEDLNRYPRDLARDLELLEPFTPQAVFAPSAAEMYPAGFGTYIEPGPAAAPLEGAVRPGHFRGVATVVLKLFNLTGADVAYFGQKDFQQVAVIRAMTADLNCSTGIEVCPTVRAPDGVALSSRLAYLDNAGRSAASVLHRTLRRASDLFQSGETNPAALVAEIGATMSCEARARLDYAAIVHPISLRPVDRVEPGTVALIAARVDGVRLIDNVIFGPKSASQDELLAVAAGR